MQNTKVCRELDGQTNIAIIEERSSLFRQWNSEPNLFSTNTKPKSIKSNTLKEYAKEASKTSNTKNFHYCKDTLLSNVPSSTVSPTTLINAVTEFDPITESVCYNDQLCDPNEELGRENAHFNISEAAIIAIEQLLCKNRMIFPMRRKINRKFSEEDDDYDDDEVIEQLKEKIRERRKEKERMRRMLRSKRSCPNVVENKKSDSTTEDLLSSTSLDSDFEFDPSKLSPARSVLRDIDSSVPLRSGCDVTNNTDVLSNCAENVALCLLRLFSSKDLPKDTQSQWLVTENEAPQQLLPLPNSWPVSPDELEEISAETTIRGNCNWAPPRQQIIFTTHPPPCKKTLLEKQRYLCAGCGITVPRKYAGKYRYCEYLGRYFCTGCHGNQLSIIPGKVISNWDFTRYPVSSFSYKLLEQIHQDSLFAINDINPCLYDKSKKLAKCRMARMQLTHLHDFIIYCRFATELHEKFRIEELLIKRDPDLYSLKDLIDINCGYLVTKLEELIHTGMKHVAACQLCYARGFVCEVCRSSEIIFPWQVHIVDRCQRCGTCMHKMCISNSAINFDCPRCQRLSQRVNSI